MVKSMAPPAHATATSSPRLHLRMQLQPARRACICAATSSSRLHLRMQLQPARRACSYLRMQL
jgi:hypothetical protein